MVTKKIIDEQIDITIPMWENCPRFSFCNVNKCPLHPDFKKLKSYIEDKERKCSLGKTRKKRILKYYPLKKQKEAEITKENSQKQAKMGGSVREKE